ncbi:basic proline-rich protein-like [Equus quagga]|uniref:basic proline-rich protein-like n=1 Tax=Equus quagga TaxID=89248 RepID=UPI001EE1C5B8|nr:basic proline-rich protein-like [Equus quagga]
MNHKPVYLLEMKNSELHRNTCPLEEPPCNTDKGELGKGNRSAARTLPAASPWDWFYLAVPGPGRARSQPRRDHPRAPRSPPPRSKSAVAPHLARALRWAPHLLTERSGRCGRREPPGHLPPGPAERPVGSPAAPSAPSHPRAARPVTQPGIGAGPGASRLEARPGAPARRPPAAARVCLPGAPSVRPPAWSAGPRTAEVRTSTTPRGKSAPALPAARAPRLAPRGSRFLPAPPPPRPPQGETFSGEKFLAWLRALASPSSGSLLGAPPQSGATESPPPGARAASVPGAHSALPARRRRDRREARRPPGAAPGPRDPGRAETRRALSGRRKKIVGSNGKIQDQESGPSQLHCDLAVGPQTSCQPLWAPVSSSMK